MKMPSRAEAFEVLCLQAGDDGRDHVLFGDNVDRVRNALRPFMIEEALSDVYLEFPLAGKPFLDVTVLYGETEPGAHIDSPAAAGADEMLNWYSAARKEHPEIACGFELDVKHSDLPAAAIHFQPRSKTELVRPFCEVVGEPSRGELYLERAAHMPKGWPLSFFGMFRGRPGSPLRVCGYLDEDVRAECAKSPSALAAALDEIGFEAYDDAMLAQISKLMDATPGLVDFQLDVKPDGTLSNMLAFDFQFDIVQPELVRSEFADGKAAGVMSLLESWGAADSRWKLAADAAFARAIPVELEDGTIGRFGFTLMPQWAKARWRNGTLETAKLYYLGNANLIAG